MAANIAQRLGAMATSSAAILGGQDYFVGDIDLDGGGGPRLVDHAGQGAPQVVGRIERRSQVVDEAADLANRCLEASIARSTRVCLIGCFIHEFGDVVERERDRVQALDHAVVQVAPDPVALVDHC